MDTNSADIDAWSQKLMWIYDQWRQNKIHYDWFQKKTQLLVIYNGR